MVSFGFTAKKKKKKSSCKCNAQWCSQSIDNHTKSERDCIKCTKAYSSFHYLTVWHKATETGIIQKLLVLMPYKSTTIMQNLTFITL